MHVKTASIMGAFEGLAPVILSFYSAVYGDVASIRRSITDLLAISIVRIPVERCHDATCLESRHPGIQS